MANENDFMQMAKDLAKAERELKIEHFVKIHIEYVENGQRILYKAYDLRKDVYFRRKWVIDWREARLRCKKPNVTIRRYYTYYDKRSGLNLGYSSQLSTLIAAKAQVTKINRAIEEYLEMKKQDLFFDVQNDPILQKAYAKIKEQQKKIQIAEEKLKKLVDANH